MTPLTEGEVFISAAVEGPPDDAVIRRLIGHVRAAPADIHVKFGKAKLLAKIDGYNYAAQYSPWVVLVDLDDEPCVLTFIQDQLPNPAPLMCFRVAMREIEAWLLADRERIARFLGVALSRIPASPDTEADPKRIIVELARRSRRTDIRVDMVPTEHSARPVGPAYTSRLIEYALQYWRPDRASENSESLRRCIAALEALVKRARA